MAIVVADDNIYPLGCLVRETNNPTVLMYVEYYRKRIYYCRIKDRPEEIEKPFFERELRAEDQKDK